jgi:ribosomal protein S18 acetylase RimI-like enzyme
MVIEIAETTVIVPRLMQILTDCRQSMREQGIYQWDEIYPDPQGIYNDVREKALFIARDSDLCVGLVCLDRNAPDEYRSVPWSCSGGSVLVVHRLCVHPNWQRKGVARALMNFAEQFGRSEGCTCIHLDAYSGNARAIDLYERRGYRRRGHVYFSRRSLPFVCFELEIARGKV